MAEVDLGAVGHNLGRIRARAPGAAVYGVVKADAYGHGMLPVARALVDAGADGLCVALVEEGLLLREAGLTLPILVFNGAFGREHGALLRAGLTPVVYEPRHLQDLAEAAAGGAVDGPVDVHVKIDTGMSRLGVPGDALPAFLDALAACPQLRVAGAMTHLSSADTDAEFTALQLDRLASGLALLRARGHAPRLVHAANSAGVYAAPLGQCNMVRPGLALYGVPPVAGCDPDLRPVMRVTSEVISLRALPVGAAVGYGQYFVADRATRIATVPIGYGDGLMRVAGGRGHMLVRGIRCPIVGRVSMDLATLDVGAVPGVQLGDPVVLIGGQGSERLDADALAKACGTIPYEVLTLLTARVPRRHLKAGH